jgi:hypothetical protein
VGLERLVASEAAVGAMKGELLELQPRLIATSAEVEATLADVNLQTAAAEQKRGLVQHEEAIAAEKAKAAKAIKAG